MADAIDDDTLAGVVAKWKDSPALRSLIAEPQAGTLKSGQLPLYAKLESALDRRESAGTLPASGGIPWMDYRIVTITIVGIKARVIEAVNATLAVFNQKTELLYPSGALFRQWWPLEEGKMEQDPDRKEGQDQWRGIIQGRVWSVRLSGS